MRKLLMKQVSNIREHKSRKLTFDDAVQVWIMTWKQEYKHKIASKFDVNVGRVYDVYNEKLHPGSKTVADYLMRHGGEKTAVSQGIR